MQIVTWTLFIFQQFYFLVYLGTESSLHEAKAAMITLSAIHLGLTIAVIKFAIDVTKCDTSHMSEEEEETMEKLGKIGQV